MHKLPLNEGGGKPSKHNLHINERRAEAIGSPDANVFPPALTHHWQCEGRRGFPFCPSQLAIIESMQVHGPACRDLIRNAVDLTWPTFLFLFFPECYSRRVRDTRTPVSETKPKVTNWLPQPATPQRKLSGSVPDLQDLSGPSRTRGQDHSQCSSIFNIWGFL